jgi:dTDP-glucose 4,6-dehydratase
VYNIGGNNERTNLDVVRAILAVLDRPESLIRFVQDRPGHDRRYAIDATKIRTRLGWAPHYAFEDGLRQTIEWYVDHQDWCQRVLTGEYMHYYQQQYGSRLGI